MSFLTTGGVYMIPMLIIGLVGLVLLSLVVADSLNAEPSTRTRRVHELVKHIAILLLVLGILSQAQGLYQALGAIEMAGDIPPALLAGGLKMSLIAPIFGLIEFVVLYGGYALVKARQ